MRKINFLGMEMMVADEEDRAKSSPGTFYVMVRVADSDMAEASPDLLARRIKVRCDRCREVCWLDPESYKGFPRSLQRICTQCLEKKLIAQQQENA